MRKKVIILSFFILISTAGLFFYSLGRSSGNSSQLTCPFCDEQVINRQKFYEDQLVVVLCTQKPIIPSHFLIMPKRHVERLEMLTTEEFTHIHQVIDKLCRASQHVFQTSPYLIHQKNGREVGQNVPHVHFHFIAKRSGDDSIFMFLIKILWAHLRGPISPEEMYKVIEKMRPAMELHQASS